MNQEETINALLEQIASLPGITQKFSLADAIIDRLTAFKVSERLKILSDANLQELLREQDAWDTLSYYPHECKLRSLANEYYGDISSVNQMEAIAKEARRILESRK